MIKEKLDQNKEGSIKEGEEYEVFGMDGRYVRIERIFLRDAGIFKKRKEKWIRYKYVTGRLGVSFKETVWGDMKMKEFIKNVIQAHDQED